MTESTRAKSLIETKIDRQERVIRSEVAEMRRKLDQIEEAIDQGLGIGYGYGVIQSTGTQLDMALVMRMALYDILLSQG